MTCCEVAALRADGGHAADERGAGAEIARHLALHDEQEEDRGDPAHHDRELRVQAHDEGEDEGGAEHRDDVLGAEADGAPPAQSLVGRDDLARGQGPSVAVELPTDGHAPS